MPKTMAIFGTCATYYPFSTKATSPRDIIVKRVHSRATIRSMISPLAKPVEYIEDLSLVPPLTSEKRFLLADLQKQIYEDLLSRPAESLLLDLTGEFRPTAIWRGSLITYSDYFQMFVDESLRKDIEVMSALAPEIIQETTDLLPQFMDRFIEMYGKENIMIHEIYPADHYYSASGEYLPFQAHVVEQIRQETPLIRYYYETVKKLYPDIKMIQVDPQYSVSYEGHPWGADPGHMLPEYFDSMLQQILEPTPVH